MGDTRCSICSGSSTLLKSRQVGIQFSFTLSSFLPFPLNNCVSLNKWTYFLYTSGALAVKWEGQQSALWLSSDLWLLLQCSLAYLSGYWASISTLDDVQVLPCLWFWGPYILHLLHFKLGSVLVHKISWPLESLRNLTCLLCTTLEVVSPPGSHGFAHKSYFCHLSTTSLHCQAECQAPLR